MTTINPPSEDCLRILEEAPGIFVNTFLYQFADVAKVVMCEQTQNGGRVIPRACVLLTETNARYLMAALQEWLDKKAEFENRARFGTFVVPPEGKPN